MDSDAFINPRYGSTIEMGGRPAPMPPRPSRHGADPEIRMLATRSRSLSDTMARERQESRPQTVRELVQVYDGGNLPTQANLVYWTHPVEIDAEDVEGATPSFTPDASQTIPVVFIRNPPNLGDYAVAHAVAGRWVAEKGGHPGCGPVSCGFFSCGSYQIPTKLILTDADGDVEFDYDPNYFYPLWTGGHSVQRSSATVQTPQGICIVQPPSVGPVRVCYQMICHNGQEPTFAIQRSWSWVYQQNTLNPIWYQDPSGFTPGGFCITAPPGPCGSPLTDTASFGADPNPANPFTISGKPAAAASNATGDPVGGAITIRAADPTLTPSSYCVTFCLSFCNVPYNGATVTVSASGKTVATGKTSGNGCVILNIGNSGTYTVTITIPSEGVTKTVYQKTQALKCGSYNIEIDCGSCDWATVLPTIHVTDSSQTVACAWNGFQWRGCYKLSLGSAYDSCSCWSDVTDPGAGECLIVYIITCQAVGGCVFNVQRQWYVCGAGGKAGYCADNIGDFGNGCGPVPSNCGGEEHTCTGFGFDVANAAVVDPCDADWPVSVDLDLGQIGLTGVTLDSPLGAKVTLQP